MQFYVYHDSVLYYNKLQKQFSDNFETYEPGPNFHQSLRGASREDKSDLTIFEDELLAFGDKCNIYSVKNNLWSTGIISPFEGVKCDDNQVQLINVDGSLFIFVKVKNFVKHTFNPS